MNTEAMLETENARLRQAGTDMARAALRVIVEYDGLHRLAMEVSEWCKVLGTEHGRGEASNEL